MSNQHANALVLKDLNGIALDHSQGTVIAVSTLSALTGSLTFSGITNADGSPASWTLNAGSNGVYQPPASGKYCSNLSFVYSNAADKGKAFIAFTPA